MDAELTFDEVLEVVKQPAIRVRRELLYDLADGMRRLVDQASLLPLKLHDIVRVGDYREVSEALLGERTTIEELVFWSDLASASRLPRGMSAPGGGSGGGRALENS